MFSMDDIEQLDCDVSDKSDRFFFNPFWSFMNSSEEESDEIEHKDFSDDIDLIEELFNKM